MTMAGADIDHERTGRAYGARQGAVQSFIEKPADDMFDFGTMGRGRRRRHGESKLERYYSVGKAEYGRLW
jgi:hypothetical protein